MSQELEELSARGAAGWPPFLERYADVVYRAARRATSDEDEARTLAADVLEHLHADWPAVLQRFLATARGERAQFSVWLAVVARRAAIDRLRARYGRRTVPSAVRRGSAWLRRAWRSSFVEERPLEEVWQALANLPGAPATLGELAFALAPFRPPVTPVGTTRTRLATLAEDVAAPPEADRQDAARARERLREVFARLPGDDLLLLRLYFLEGASAEALRRLHGSATRSQVYNRIHTLLGAIRAQLENLGLAMDDLGNPHGLDLGAWLEAPEESDPPVEGTR
ncbi:MAG: hypothetical protein WD226_05955 [Planctomycetota bacterium]